MSFHRLMSICKTVPTLEPGTINKKLLCTIWYDITEKRLIRLKDQPYYDVNVKRWSTIDVDIDKDLSDYRLQSYKTNNFSGFNSPNDIPKNKKRQTVIKQDVIASCLVSSINDLQIDPSNTSVGIIRPERDLILSEGKPIKQAIDLYTNSPANLPTIQMEFRCEGEDKIHKMPLRDLEAYTTVKRFGIKTAIDRYNEIIASKQCYIVMGNTHIGNRAKTFMAIGFIYVPWRIDERIPKTQSTWARF